jgi:hypothetical protein
VIQFSRIFGSFPQRFSAEGKESKATIEDYWNYMEGNCLVKNGRFPLFWAQVKAFGLGLFKLKLGLRLLKFGPL